MKTNGTSENYQNQNLKVMIVFANFLGSINFFDEKSKQQIIAFLDIKVRNSAIDADKRWIPTWNDYLWRIKYFLRWLYNQRKRREMNWANSTRELDYAFFCKYKEKEN